jgi:hypothetical protein
MLAIMNILTKNPFLKSSKAWMFCEICNVDYTTGHSDIVHLEKLLKYNLQTSNGGDWCRSDGNLGKYFNINRIKQKGKIVGVQLVGYKKNTFSNMIKKEILEFYKKLPCKVLNIGGKYIEVDHKDGRKDDYSLNQKLEDFQPFHKSVNDAKRTHCNNCKNSGKRFDATILGFSVSQWIGTKEYNGSCIGCFWYDPAEFNAQVSTKYKKLK